MITLYKASVADAALLTTLAREIYRQHYLHLWHPTGADWYIEKYAYAPETIEKELADENCEYIIAEENGANPGYMKLVLTAALPGEETKNAMEIERIYLHTATTGKGLGSILMEAALNRARELKKEILFLKAMDSGAGAIAFYKKMGYTICGSLQLPLPEFELMKAEYRGMVILRITVQ